MQTGQIKVDFFSLVDALLLYKDMAYIWNSTLKQIYLWWSAQAKKSQKTLLVLATTKT